MRFPERHNSGGGPMSDSGNPPRLEDLATLNVHPITAGERKFSHILLFLEQIIKVPLFRCRSCGECLLSSTAFICSQNCPKRLRNGPCGGTREDGSCEVFPDRKCIWYKIYVRSKLLHRTSFLYKTNRIHNWTLERTSTWLNVLRKRTEGPVLFHRKNGQRAKDIIVDGAAGKD
jgi:methylenetetrahydrofolate reductase (NADPH)